MEAQDLGNRAGTWEGLEKSRGKWNYDKGTEQGKGKQKECRERWKGFPKKGRLRNDVRGIKKHKKRLDDQMVGQMTKEKEGVGWHGEWTKLTVSVSLTGLNYLSDALVGPKHPLSHS